MGFFKKSCECTEMFCGNKDGKKKYGGLCKKHYIKKHEKYSDKTHKSYNNNDCDYSLGTNSSSNFTYVYGHGYVASDFAQYSHNRY